MKDKNTLLNSKLPSGVVLKDKLNMEKRSIELQNYIDNFIPEIKNLSQEETGNKYVIDLGPGPGDFLEICRKYGFNIKGYDAKLDSIKGMGMDYVNLCAIYVKEKDIPIDYCNFEETGFNGIEDNSVYLINSRGSFEQIFSKYLIGDPIENHHDSRKLIWNHSNDMYKQLSIFLDTCYLKLVTGGYLFISFNGTKDNTLFVSNLKNIIDTKKFNIHILDMRYLKLIKI